MNPFTIVNGTPYPLDMRGELDDTALFKNFQKYDFLAFALSVWFFRVASIVHLAIFMFLGYQIILSRHYCLDKVSTTELIICGNAQMGKCGVSFAFW